MAGFQCIIFMVSVRTAGKCISTLEYFPTRRRVAECFPAYLASMNWNTCSRIMSLFLSPVGQAESQGNLGLALHITQDSISVVHDLFTVSAFSHKLTHPSLATGTYWFIIVLLHIV